VGSDSRWKAQQLRFKERKLTIFVGGEDHLHFVTGGQNRSLHPVASVTNMTIKQRTEGFGLKRPGDGMAANFFEVIWDEFFVLVGG
jgi:hypothetical protein